MKRREFIQLSVPAFLILANGKLIAATTADKRKKSILRFVVASDGHYGQPDTDYQQYFARLVNRINEEHAKEPFSFCVINGDIIHDDKQYFPAAKNALDDLAPKYYVSQGNHDHVDAAEWESIWNMPVNLSFRIGDSSFLVASTSNEKGEYLCPDIDWLREQLESAKSQRHIFIFIHINPARLTKYGVDCKPLLELFANHPNITAVFNGHDHDEDGIKRKENISYIFDAHFGGNWGTAYRGFRVVEILEDHSMLTYILDPVKRINEASMDHALNG